MTKQALSVKDLPRLAERLARLPAIAERRGAEEGSEPEKLAHALIDIAESFEAALIRHYPRLARPEASDEELMDAIEDLREQLRHVVYHAHDSEFLRTVFEPGRDYTLPAVDAGPPRPSGGDGPPAPSGPGSHP